jgi:leucyl/phenylalanyl-tRNA---protein transferase
VIIPSAVLLEWYRHGYFPMADQETGDIRLYCPRWRGVILPEDFHIADSLRKTARGTRWSVTINTRFEDVIRACARRDETWISTDIIDTYTALHREGHAHSVEAWRDGELAGGLYGVALGGAFFGESMFTLVRDGSKVALVALVTRMRERGMTLLDTQYITPHLMRFGAVELARQDYQRRLDDALRLPVSFLDDTVRPVAAP